MRSRTMMRPASLLAWLLMLMLVGLTSGCATTHSTAKPGHLAQRSAVRHARPNRRSHPTTSTVVQPGVAPVKALATGTLYVADTLESSSTPGVSITPIDVASQTKSTPLEAGSGPDGIVIAPNGETAYVADGGSPTLPGDTVTPVNLSTGQVGRPIGVGINPIGMAVAPNGLHLYVANAGYPGATDSTVTPINLATERPGSPIQVGLGPTSIAIAPDGLTAYVTVAGYGSSSPPTPGSPAPTPPAGKVVPINLVTGSPEPGIAVGAEPMAIAITPNGKEAYVANSGSDTVTPINLVTRVPGPPIQVGLGPSSIAIAPDGLTAYVTVAGFGPSSPPASGSPISLPAGKVVPINLTSATSGPPITVGVGPLAIAITPNGNEAYVANAASGTVTPINLVTNTPEPGVPVAGSPEALAITSVVHVKAGAGKSVPKRAKSPVGVVARFGVLNPTTRLGALA